jgi:hypothetical protein
MLDDTAVIYEVTATVRGDLCEPYEKYITEQHINDILRTGCFVEATFSRSDSGHYRVEYAAVSRRGLDEYLANHAHALREDFASRFPEGVTLKRDEWTTIRTFPAQRSGVA